ncbi:MAG: hypothetical protein D6734_09920 [Candidatus Schekmanbacteria bacterium]|nr:MAG: hypothetical protein D6734_09920 [Candidatus Schekmanbacteria bacterium]
MISVFFTFSLHSFYILENLYFFVIIITKLLFDKRGKFGQKIRNVQKDYSCRKVQCKGGINIIK